MKQYEETGKIGKENGWPKLAFHFSALSPLSALAASDTCNPRNDEPAWLQSLT